MTPLGPPAERRDTAAPRTRHLEPLGIIEILLLGRQHGAIDLATGSPSFPDTPAELVASACAALRSGHNQYDDPAGHRELRMAVAQVHDADPDTEITVTGGCTEGLNVVLQSLVQPGDEVILAEPYYEAYPSAIRLAGGVPRFVRLREPGWCWRPDELAAAFGPRTRAVIVNSPHNPTGRVLTAAELAELAALAQTWGAFVISDEVYTEFRNRPEAVPSVGMFPAIADRTVVLRSLSKSHAIGGWRIGWIYAPAALTATFRMVHETLTTGVATPLQVAAAHIMRSKPGWTGAERSQLVSNRTRVIAALRAIGLTCEPPEGSAFLLARLPEQGYGDAAAFARRLITECGVTAAPGDLFFSVPAAGSSYLRFSYNKADPLIAAGADRIRRLRSEQLV
jgi:N-succinyldiaminopimelate aminotransferase